MAGSSGLLHRGGGDRVCGEAHPIVVVPELESGLFLYQASLQSTENPKRVLCRYQETNQLAKWRPWRRQVRSPRRVEGIQALLLLSEP